MARYGKLKQSQQSQNERNSPRDFALSDYII